MGNWRGINSDGVDTLNIGGILKAGSSAAPVAYTAGKPNVALYFTNAGTSGTNNAEPFYVKSVLTGAGQVGGRSRFDCYSNVASGGWINALKAYMEFGAAGSTSGLASALCAELVLSAGTAAAHYAAIEAELVAGTGAKGGQVTSFFHCNGGGADVASIIDGAAVLFDFGAALDAGSGKFIDTDKKTHTKYGGIRINIDGVGIKYLAVVSD